MAITKNTLPSGPSAYGDGTSGTFYQITESDEVHEDVANLPNQHLGLRDDILKVTQDAIIDAINDAHQGTAIVAASEVEHDTYLNSLQALLQVAHNVDGSLKATATNRAPDGYIGVPGDVGFGVGVCPVQDIPFGMRPLPGYDIPGHPNYGNYMYTIDSSVMVFIPTFFYKILADGILIVGYDPNPNTSYGFRSWWHALNGDVSRGLDGDYTLHRAFIDGDRVKSGVFVDKYLNSPRRIGFMYALSDDEGVYSLEETLFTVPSSLPRERPLGGSSDEHMSELTACATNEVWQIFNAAHSRDNVLGLHVGTSQFAPCSVFVYGALAMLSLAHGRATYKRGLNHTWCAWFDPSDNRNHPAGGNNKAAHLGDVQDTTFVYLQDRTGSAYNRWRTGLPKTAHNGQYSGVVDLHGVVSEVACGLTMKDVGESPVWYVLQKSKSVRLLTGGAETSEDHFAPVSTLESRFEILEMPPGTPYFSPYAHFLHWQASTGQALNTVLDPATSSDSFGWLLTCMGFPKDTNALYDETGGDAPWPYTGCGGGTQFGEDVFLVSNEVAKENCLISCGGDSTSGGRAGVWTRTSRTRTSTPGLGVGLRCCLYHLGGTTVSISQAVPAE